MVKYGKVCTIMNKVKEYNIRIRFKAGSDYQQKLFDEMVEAYLLALRLHFSHSHIDNGIEISTQGKDLDERYLNNGGKLYRL